MADVTLVLKAQNTDYINKVREAQRESQKLYDTNEKSMKREKGIIEEIEEKLKELHEAKRKAYSYEEIEKQNKKIAETKMYLKEYEEAGLKANEKVSDSGGKVAKIYAGIAAAIAAAASAFNVLKNAVMDTESGFSNMNVVLAATKQLLYDIIQRTPIKEWGKNMKEVASIQANMEKLRRIERDTLKEVAKYQVLYNKYLVEAKDQTKTNEERLINYNKALIANNRSIDIENKNTATRLALVREWLKTTPDSITLLDEESALTVKLYQIEEKRYASQKEINSMRTGLIKESTLKAIQEEVDAEVKGVKNYERLKQQYLKNEEEKRKKVEVNSDWITRIRKRTAEAEKEISKGLTEYERMQEEQRIAAVKKAEEEKNRARQSAWQMIFDSEKAIFDILGNINQSKLSEELAVIEKRSQVAIKAAGNDEKKILAIEEKAKQDSLAIEKRYQKEQQKIAIAQTIINGATAIVKLFKDYTYLIAVPLSIAMGALTALQVGVIKSQKFAKGGWTGKGGMRDDTGERIAGIVHEEEFVTRKGPAKKYREVLEAINKDDRRLAMNRFNMIAPETIIAPVNNVSVENSGPNTRLDRINNQLYNLNRLMQPKKQVSQEMSIIGNTIIIRKGTNIRTVKR